MSSQHHLTQAGLDKFKTDLERLKERRAEVVAIIAAAREQGDLSENSEYQTAKEDQEIIESSIHEIEIILKNAILIDHSEKSTAHQISLGSTVELREVNTAEKLTVSIVGSMETNPFENKISDASPLGSELMGKMKGDTIDLPHIPEPATYKILAVS